MWESLARVNAVVGGVVWGPVGLALLFGTGCLLTVRTGFFQLRYFGYWMRHTIGAIFLDRNVTAHTDDEAISQFQSLCTALAATIGTGNIVGVAAAILAGGPGAVFWMWVMALLGMMTSYAENVLGICYRRRDAAGRWCGGPMYYLAEGLGGGFGRALAVLFACFCVLASFGMGNMSQINSIAGNLQAVFRVPPVATGIVLALLTGRVILGGCELGPRPIDLHLSALSALGAEIRETGGELKCRGGTLLGSDVYLPMPSVGATENALLCACGADGVTTIYNAAREPEIVDLQKFINAMGGNVRGAGGSIITVEGKRALHGGKYRIIADRIVGATYLCAAACCGGEVRLRGVDPRPLSTVSGALSEAGCTVKSGEDDVFLQSDGSLRSIRPVRTAPYPGFPTDAQPVLMAALLKSAGSTVFVENIFENRYRHVDELARMGAEVRVAGRVAVVTGREHLHGARVKCTDLRAGAALVIAGLQADGLTRISRIEHIDRGYESIERDLGVLGAHVRRETGT